MPLTIFSVLFCMILLLGLIVGSGAEMSYVIFRSDRSHLKKINYDAVLVCILLSVFILALPVLMLFAKQTDDMTPLQTKIIAATFLVGSYIGCMLSDELYSDRLKVSTPIFKIFRRLPIV